jgi:hypothetical protein
MICKELGIVFDEGAPRPQMMDVIPPLGTFGMRWTRDAVWTRLVQIIFRQLRVNADEIEYS